MLTLLSIPLRPAFASTGEVRIHFLNAQNESCNNILDNKGDPEKLTFSTILSSPTPCIPSKLHIIAFPPKLSSTEQLLENVAGPVGGLFEGIMETTGLFGSDSLFGDEGAVDYDLERPGIQIVIGSESGNIIQDLNALHTNGLSHGIPVRWYIEEYEVWRQDTGERYKYPISNIPITKGVIRMDLTINNIKGADFVTGIIGGAIGGALLGGLGGGAQNNQPDENVIGGIGVNSGIGAGIGAGVGAMNELGKNKVQLVLQIKDNYIDPITVDQNIEEGAVLKETTGSLIEKNSLGIELELANGLTTQVVTQTDTFQFGGKGRQVTKEGLSTFDPSDIEGISNEKSLLQQIIKLTNWVLGFVGAIAVLMLVYAGILITAAGGSADIIKKGKNIVLYAVIGIIVLIGSYTIANTVLNFSGPAYRVTFELRDPAGGKIIGVNLTDGSCLVTTLPLIGEVNVCHRKQYLTIEANSPLFKNLAYPISQVQLRCFPILQGSIYGCFGAPDGRPDQFNIKIDTAW